MQTGTNEVLDKIFSELDLGRNYSALNETERLESARHYALALFQEVAELTDSFQFAPWKLPNIDRENIKREVIDCLYFLHHICRCFNVTPAELQEKYNWVLENNKRRYNNDNRNS